jgi:hypothetical protein
MSDPALFQIDCVVRDDRRDPYERVVGVGGPNSPDAPPPDASALLSGLRKRGLAIRDRPRWTLPVEEAIQGILDGRWSFFIQYDAWQTVGVEVATSPAGRRYLKTEADTDTPDQLLYLPQCR